MFGILKRLKKTKTLWICIAAIVSAVTAYLTGQIDFAALLQAIITALIATGLRDGIHKAIKGPLYGNRRAP